jgi:hypothetical protein
MSLSSFIWSIANLPSDYKKSDDGKVILPFPIEGVDVFRPSTGEVRSNGMDEIGSARLSLGALGGLPAPGSKPLSSRCRLPLSTSPLTRLGLKHHIQGPVAHQELGRPLRGGVD